MNQKKDNRNFFKGFVLMSNSLKDLFWGTALAISLVACGKSGIKPDDGTEMPSKVDVYKKVGMDFRPRQDQYSHFEVREIQIGSNSNIIITGLIAILAGQTSESEKVSTDMLSNQSRKVLIDVNVPNITYSNSSLDGDRFYIAAINPKEKVISYYADTTNAPIVEQIEIIVEKDKITTVHKQVYAVNVFLDDAASKGIQYDRFATKKAFLDNIKAVAKDVARFSEYYGLKVKPVGKSVFYDLKK